MGPATRHTEGPFTPPAPGAGGGWEIADFSYESLLELGVRFSPCGPTPMWCGTAGSMAVSLGLTRPQIARLPRHTYHDGRLQGLSVPPPLAPLPPSHATPPTPKEGLVRWSVHVCMLRLPLPPAHKQA